MMITSELRTLGGIRYCSLSSFYIRGFLLTLSFELLDEVRLLAGGSEECGKVYQNGGKANFCRYFELAHWPNLII